MKYYIRILFIIIASCLLSSCSFLIRHKYEDTLLVDSKELLPLYVYTNDPYNNDDKNKTLLIIVDNSINLKKVTQEYLISRKNKKVAQEYLRGENTKKVEERRRLALNNIQNSSQVFADLFKFSLEKMDISAGNILIANDEDLKKLGDLNSRNEKIEYLKNKYGADLILSVKLYTFYYHQFFGKERVFLTKIYKKALIFSADYFFELINSSTKKTKSSGWLQMSDFTRYHATKKEYLSLEDSSFFPDIFFYSMFYEDLFVKFAYCITHEMRHEKKKYYPVLENLRYRNVATLFEDIIHEKNHDLECTMYAVYKGINFKKFTAKCSRKVYSKKNIMSYPTYLRLQNIDN